MKLTEAQRQALIKFMEKWTKENSPNKLSKEEMEVNLFLGMNNLLFVLRNSGEIVYE